MVRTPALVTCWVIPLSFHLVIISQQLGLHKTPLFLYHSPQFFLKLYIQFPRLRWLGSDSCALLNIHLQSVEVESFHIYNFECIYSNLFNQVWHCGSFCTDDGFKKWSEITSHHQYFWYFVWCNASWADSAYGHWAGLHHSLMSLTWGAVTADGADVFSERQDRAWGLGGHLHHAVEAQRGLNVLRAADRVHRRVQLEHQHTQTHTPTGHKADPLNSKPATSYTPLHKARHIA